MEMEKLKMAKVKLSARSITCKDENGKICGIVRNITRFNDLQSNKKQSYWKIIKNAGLWGNSESDKVYISSDGEIYYMFDVLPLKEYEKLFEKFSLKLEFKGEKEEYNKRKQIAENAAKFVTVIPCYILKF
jgi:hypothetical protein